MGRFYMTWRNCMLMYDTLYETLKPLCLIGVLLYRNNLWKSCFYLLFSHKTCCFGKFSGWYFSFYHFSVPEGPNYSSVVSSSDIFLSASRVSIVSFWLFSWDSHVTPFSMANGQYISFSAVEGLQYFCGCPQNVRVLMSYFKAETRLYSTFMVELVTRHDRSLGCGNLITSFFS